jgi:hypothetical protein
VEMSDRAILVVGIALGVVAPLGVVILLLIR